MEMLIEYLSYPFVRYAIIVGVLIAFCSSLLGVTLVLKRMSYIGDGLSHVAFGALAIASVLKLSNNMYVILPVTVLAAIILLAFGKNAAIKGDAAIAIILSVIVVIVFILFYNKIFAVTFDETFAKATGVRTGAYNLLIAVIIAVIIVLAMNLVGSLLISALVIFPAMASMRVFKSFKAVTVSSAVFSVFCALAGMFISIIASTPTGATIVACDAVMFGVFCVIGAIRQ